MHMDELLSLTELERAVCLQNLLIAHATGGGADDGAYRFLRGQLMESATLAVLLPKCVRTCRDLSQFWGFIKFEYKTYAERRQFLWAEFRLLLDHLEGRNKKPADASISDRLMSFDADGVHAVWAKAIERRSADPEGAITAARTLIETVCKHILDAQGVAYDAAKIDLPELYRLTSKELRLAPGQHTEDTFKKILGGVTSVVNELGSLRNRLGDAHGQGKVPVKPGVRHAALAVNLAGSVAMFLVDTFNARTESAHEK
jgi:hypothetical protein